MEKFIYFAQNSQLLILETAGIWTKMILPRVGMDLQENTV
jgi:hypothetical protein